MELEFEVEKVVSSKNGTRYNIFVWDIFKHSPKGLTASLYNLDKEDVMQLIQILDNAI